MEFVEFWKFIPGFAQRKELNINSRNLEVDKEQCTSYCIFRVAGKATGGIEKKKFDFLGSVPVFFGIAVDGCCEILGGCSSFHAWKKS